MTQDEINYFLNEVTENITPKYKKINRWGETEEQYQKWLRSNADGWLTAKGWSLGSRVVMSHLWNKIDHNFDMDVNTYWSDELRGPLAFNPDYPYQEFKQSDLAKELGMTNKGIREILENISDTDYFVQRHPFKFGYWIHNGESVIRSYQR